MIKKKLNKRAIVKDLSFNVASLAILLIFVLPIYYIIAGALMTREEVYSAALFPKSPNFNNIGIALFDFNMLRFLGNSVFFTVIIVVLNLFFCALSGYALVKFNFPGKNILYVLTLVAMVVPPLVMIVPLYLEVRQFGWKRIRYKDI